MPRVLPPPPASSTALHPVSLCFGHTGLLSVPLIRPPLPMKLLLLLECCPHHGPPPLWGSRQGPLPEGCFPDSPGQGPCAQGLSTSHLALSVLIVGTCVAMNSCLHLSPTHVQLHRADLISIRGCPGLAETLTHTAGAQFTSVEGSRMNQQEHQKGDLLGISGEKEKTQFLETGETNGH